MEGIYQVFKFDKTNRKIFQLLLKFQGKQS